MKRYIKANAVEPDKTYQNRRNPNKFIETKKYDDGHTVARQYMKWDTPEGEVKNYNGSKTNRGRYHRAGKHTLDMMLEDYDEIESTEAICGGGAELPDMTDKDNVYKYIQICDAYPEYYEEEGIAAHVDFNDGTANFWQIAPNQWKLVIFNEDEYNPETYVYENDPYWGTDELMPGEVNDIILSSDELYAELSSLPGVELYNFYGQRNIFDDFSDIIS